MIIKRLSLALLSSLLVLSGTSSPRAAGQQAPSTADEVVERHLAALGGRAALSKLTSRRSTGTITIGTPNGDLSGTVELLSKAPNKTRALIELDLSAMGMAERMRIDQRFDGTAGWALNSLQGNTQITGNQLDNMKSNVFPTPLLTYKQAGTVLELLPRETVGGKSAIVIGYTPKVGSPVRMYFDPETYLLRGSIATVNVPQMGGDLEQVSEVSDYRVVDGVNVPFMMVNSNPMQTVTFRLQKVEHNVDIPDEVFTVKAPATRPAAR